MPEHPVPHQDVAGYVLGILEPHESAGFEEHLGSCAACRREVADLGPLGPVLGQALPVPAVPPGLAQRTFVAVEAAASPAPAASPSRARHRPRRAWVAASAGVAAAIALTAAVLAAQDRPAGVQIALVAVDGGNAEGVATLRRDDSGVAVELEVDGLAVPRAGGFYECWYVGEADAVDRPARLSAGTFTVAAGGATTVRMTTAADPRRYPRIEVTLEPDDGDPARTGPVVLRSRPRPGSGPSR